MTPEGQAAYDALAKLRANQPGPLAMAAGLATALVDHARDGFRRTPADFAEDRRALCLACPDHDHQADRCRLCGCVFLAQKRAMASSECPAGKWKAV